MKNIFIINGGQSFAHAGGAFNATLAADTLSYFSALPGYEVRTTDINQNYDPAIEVKNFVWADIVIYHTPIWWFQLPFRLKEYIDVVFSAGHRKGIYRSDGRSASEPKLNYGTGGSLHGRKYMLTTTWNAPETAFTLPGEFFQERSVDEGVMFGFHRMNAFAGMQPLKGMHFHDLEKNVTELQVKTYRQQYLQHLQKTFQAAQAPVAAICNA